MLLGQMDALYHFNIGNCVSLRGSFPMRITKLLHKYALIFLLALFLQSCNAAADNITIPLSDDSPTLLVFCNNTDVSCLELGEITPHFDDVFGADTISIGYVFIDSDQGMRIFDALSLDSTTSYVFFNSEQQELFRLVGEIELDELSERVSDSMQN